MREFILFVLLVGTLTAGVGFPFQRPYGLAEAVMSGMASGSTIAESRASGYAIASSATLREIQLLIPNGSYNSNSWLGATGTDMTPEIAETMNTNITYGWLITQATSGGPGDKVGLRGGTTQVQIAGNLVTIGGDIVIAINDARIGNMNDLSTYLEEHTLPGQTIIVTIVRNDEVLTKSLILGSIPVVVYDLTVYVINGENNNPISNAYVKVEGPQSYQDTTDANDRLVFQNIQAGSYTISASKNDYQPSSADLEIDKNTDVTLLLQPVSRKPPITISNLTVLSLALLSSASIGSAVFLMILAADRIRRHRHR